MRPLVKNGTNVKKNYLFNLAYQMFLILVPILLTPYVARVLGECGSGQYSYTFSISTYFTMFASLGFQFYAQRLIAAHQGDHHRQSVDFWEVFLARLIPSAVAVTVYVVLLCTHAYADKYMTLMWVLGIHVIAVIFDVSFFFQGNERFVGLVSRHFLIKLLSVIAILVFVKRAEDLWRYVLIQALTVLISNLSIWPELMRSLSRVSPSELCPLRHLRAALILFLPAVATSVYTYLDKTLLGLLTRADAENGYYEYAEKIIKMAMTVITSLGTVMVPRNARRYAEGDEEGIRHNIHQSARFVWFLGVPIALSLIALAHIFIPWFLGAGYEKAAILMQILAPLILIIGLSNLFGIQYLIPCGHDRSYTVAVLLGAATNLALNLILIPRYASIGAAIATLVAECVVTLLMFVFVRRALPFSQVFGCGWRNLIGGVLMVALPLYVSRHPSGNMLFMAGSLVVGGCIYLITLWILHDPFLCYLIDFLRSKLKKKGQM